MEKELEFLKEMSEVRGISGHEVEAAKVFAKYAELFGADKIEYDNLGSVIAYHYGEKGGPVVMMTGHLDEVGFIVSKIEKSGFIRLHQIGVWWNHVLLSMPMILKTSTGVEYYGVIGAQPPHGMTLEQKAKVLELKDIYFDLGVTDDKMIEKMGIRIGDTLTPNTEFRVLNDGDTLLGKAWDDRIGACIALKVLENLRGKKTKCTYVAVGTVQEEVGLRGAKTAAYKVNPDIAFATDVSLSHDIPGIEENSVKLGGGVALTVLDAGIISHPGLVSFLEDEGKALNIKTPSDIMMAGRTDAGTIHLEREGIIAMTVSLACRYYHSPNSMISYADYKDCVTLMSSAIEKIDNNLLLKLKECRYK